MNYLLALVAFLSILSFLITTGLKRSLAIDRIAREVSRNKNRRELPFEMLPKNFQSWIASHEAEITALGFRRFCFFDNEICIPGFRGSSSAVFAARDGETFFSLALIKIPITIHIPLGLGIFPITLPYPNLTAKEHWAISCEASYEDGSSCAVLNVETHPDEWWPKEVHITAVPHNSTATQVFAAFEKAVAAFLVKCPSKPLPIRSTAQYLKHQEQLQKRLSDHTERKLKEMLDAACIDHMTGEIKTGK